MGQVDLTNEQHLYLQFILDYFRQHDQWPTHRQLDRLFYQKHSNLDIENVWNSLPSDLTSYLDIHSLDNNATLTIPGMYALESNAPEFALFLAIIRLFVEIERTSENPEIGSEVILRDHPTWFGPSIYRTGWLLLDEPNICQSFSGPAQSHQWKCVIARDIRRFGSITTIEDYLENRTPPRTLPRASPASAPNDAVLSPESSIQPQQVVLHPDIQVRCWNLYTQGDYDNAILNATKAIEIAVRKKAQLPDEVVGIDVINLAFSPKNTLLQYSSIKAEQEGMMSLLRGLIQVYKNPQSHRFVGIQDDSECLGILLLCSSLLFLIDRL